MNSRFGISHVKFNFDEIDDPRLDVWIEPRRFHFQKVLTLPKMLRL
jgi:hypothetical protein